MSKQDQNEVAADHVDERHEAASRIISSAARWSAASAAIPVPVVDLVALGGVQAKMIVDLSRLYEQPASGEVARGLVSVLLGTLLPGGAAGALMGSGSKLLPGGGWVVGVASLAALGAAATFAIGKIFVRHYEGGGTLASFSAEAIKGDLKAEFNKATGRQAAGATA
jgi:uncharacterized protein (DUF697 family)